MTEYINEGIENLFTADLINYIVEELIKEKYDVEFNKVKPADLNKYKDKINHKIQKAKYKESLGYGKAEFDRYQYIQSRKLENLKGHIASLCNSYCPLIDYIDYNLKQSISENNNYLKPIIQNVLNKTYPYSKNTDENRELIKKSFIFNYYKNKINELVQREQRRLKKDDKLKKHEKNTLMKLIDYKAEKTPYYVKIFDDLYEYYKKILVNKRDPTITINDRLKNIAKEHIKHKQDKMNINDFITKYYVWWQDSKRTNEELYKVYSDEYDKLDPNNIINISFNYNETPFNKGFGYKSTNKIKSLSNKGFQETTINPININYFPLKQNIKAFQLHTIAPRHTFLIDLMFENKMLCYLIMININTRKLWVELTNMKEEDIKNEENKNEIIDEEKLNKIQQKTSSAYINALKKIMKKTTIKYLKGDGEKAFDSTEAKRFYLTNGIKFEAVRRQPMTTYPEFMNKLNMVKTIKNKDDTWKTEPKHSSLGLIDRAIRTIRDLAFNLQIGYITPLAMNYIVNLYNNAPHSTLSKYAGYEVSPNDVDNNELLEEFIVRKIQQENFNIIHSSGYKLNKGMEVKVYNERNAMSKRRSELEAGNWRVKEQIGPLFTIIDDNNNEQIKSRYQIAPFYY